MNYKARFNKYRDDSVLLKAEQYAKWTLPQLMVDIAELRGNQGAVLERDYQEVGALFTNNLAAKITSLLFPATRQFFKVAIGEDLRAAARERGIDEATLAARYAKVELAACERVFYNASYNQLMVAAKHLVVTGNALLYRDPDTARTVTYGLRSYTCKRDGLGNVVDGVLWESIAFEGLPEDVRTSLRLAQPDKYRNPDSIPNVDLYTRVQRVPKGKRWQWRISQEADGVRLDQPSTYPEHRCPYVFLHWNLAAGENYGRGHVEDFAGGFAKLSDLSEAAALYGIEIMKLVHLVAPGSGADVDELSQSEVGQYVSGTPGQVTPYDGGDYNKLIAVRQEIAEVVTNLTRAFMYTGNTRDGERVTAYEIRQNALEADNTLGGVYSSLAESWQVPLAHLLLYEEDPKQSSGIIDGTIRLNIVAGIPALGRAGDVQNLLTALTEAAAIMQAVQGIGDRRVDPERVLDIILSGSGVDSEAIFYSEAEQERNRQAQAQAQQAQSDLTAAAGLDAGDTAETLQNLGG